MGDSVGQGHPCPPQLSAGLGAPWRGGSWGTLWLSPASPREAQPPSGPSQGQAGTKKAAEGPLPGPRLLFGKGPPMTSSCGESWAEKREFANPIQDPESLGRPTQGRGRVGCPGRAEGGTGKKWAAGWGTI